MAKDKTPAEKLAALIKENNERQALRADTIATLATEKATAETKYKGQRLGQKSEGTGDLWTHLPRRRQPGSPLPPSPRDHFRLSGLGPLCLALALEGPAPCRGSGLGPPRGLGVEAEVGWPRLPKERGAPHYAGLARDARPLAPAAFSRDVPGLQPSALGDLPSSNSQGRHGGFGAEERALDPGKETRGQPPEAWEACLPRRW